MRLKNGRLMVRFLQVQESPFIKFIYSFVVIRAGLVSGKLSQTTQSLYIIRATSRNFEQEQWRALEQRLMAWKTGLASILDVVISAKKIGNQVVA